MVIGSFVLFSCNAWLGIALRQAAHTRFIIVSSPTDHNIYYGKLPSFGELSRSTSNYPEVGLKVLIDGATSKCSGEDCDEDSDRGLESPGGLAVYQGTDGAVLYVSDTSAESIYSYGLGGNFWGTALSPTISLGKQRKVVLGIPNVKSLAADRYGNLYVAADGQIMKASSADLLAGDGPVNTTVLYSKANETVSNPAGIATDSFAVYWANEEGGNLAGSVVRGLVGASAEYPRAVAAYPDKSYGVCLARDNVFFTSQGALFAVKNSGGSIAEVSHNFEEPHSCAYDGESTLYVADNKANAVYGLPGNFGKLQIVTSLFKVAQVASPWGVAVLSDVQRYDRAAAPPAAGAFLTWAITMAGFLVGSTSIRE